MAQVTSDPFEGETGVSVQREITVRFDQPLATDTQLDSQRFFAGFGGRRILARSELSSKRDRAWLFPLEPMPAGARIRVVLEGAGLRDALGRELDADGDGVPGGRLEFAYTTFGATPVAGTAVAGYVFDSESAPDGAGGFTNVPLAGVIITVDGAEQTLRTTTDVNGFFQLAPAPAGRFFVHVDGRRATGSSWPGGAYYPFIGQAWEAQPGRTNPLAGGSGFIYLPHIAAGTLQTASSTSDTVITFPPAVLAQRPDLAGVTLTVPANSLFADSGARGGRVGLAPVPPDRLPEPLPAGLALPLVITIQTDGPMNFDRPVPVRFPNLPDPITGETLVPGAKTVLWSFDHDIGRWEPQGQMTISADGRFAEVDPGVGVRQPGWLRISPSAPIAQRAGCEANPITAKNAMKLAKSAAACLKDLSGVGRALSIIINFADAAAKLRDGWADLREFYQSGNLSRAEAANLLSGIKSLKTALVDLEKAFRDQNPVTKAINAVACAADLTKTATDIGCGSGSCLATVIRVLCSNLQPFLNIGADLTKKLKDFSEGTLGKLSAVCVRLDIAIDALQSRIGDLGQSGPAARTSRSNAGDEILPFEPELAQLLDAVLTDLQQLTALAQGDAFESAKYPPTVKALEHAASNQDTFSKLLIGAGVDQGASYHFKYQRGGSTIEERAKFEATFERMVPLGQAGTLSWY